MQGGKGIGKIIEAQNEHICQVVVETPHTSQLKKQSTEAENKGAIKRGQLILVGNHTAKIVDSQCEEDGFSYYITFLSLNRRMDRWIPASEILSQLDKADIPQQEIDLF